MPSSWVRIAILAGTHAPVLIYPNPLNPKKYVVINSGFTFREFDYLNNARQIPKLPDCQAIGSATTTPPERSSPRQDRAGRLLQRRLEDVDRHQTCDATSSG